MEAAMSRSKEFRTFGVIELYRHETEIVENTDIQIAQRLETITVRTSDQCSEQA